MRRCNNSKGLLLEGSWCEEPHTVKLARREHFVERFSMVDQPLVRLDDVCFSSISKSDNVMLTNAFEEDEIKHVVWDCGGDKSLSPDGFNFSFLKHVGR